MSGDREKEVGLRHLRYVATPEGPATAFADPFGVAA